MSNTGRLTKNHLLMFKNWLIMGVIRFVFSTLHGFVLKAKLRYLAYKHGGKEHVPHDALAAAMSPISDEFITVIILSNYAEELSRLLHSPYDQWGVLNDIFLATRGRLYDEVRSQRVWSILSGGDAIRAFTTALIETNDLPLHRVQYHQAAVDALIQEATDRLPTRQYA